MIEDRLEPPLQTAQEHLLRTASGTTPQRQFWWVNQGKTYNAAKASGSIWAPMRSKDGDTRFHWENVSRVQPGDIIFNYADKLLRAISIVTSVPYESERGDLPGDWANKGWKTDLTYNELTIPVSMSEIGPAIGHLNLVRGPINLEGRVNQGYLFALTKEAADIIVQKIGRDNLPAAIAQAIGLGPEGAATDSGFASLLRRYLDERIVFISSVHKARYAITALDENGVNVERLDAKEPQRVTFAQAQKLIGRVQEAGALEFSTLDNTAAVRNTVLQAEPLALTGDRSSVRFLPDNPARLENFLDVLDHLNMANPLYEPAMLLSVLDGIDQGDLTQNRITFDWLAPRFITLMKSLGKDVNEQQAAQPFFHLSGDLFWLHAVQNTSDLMQSGSEGPAAARNKIKYALLKNTYWNLLQDSASRSAVRQKLLAIVGAAESTPEPPLPPAESIPHIPPEQILKDAQQAVEATGFLSPPGQIRRFLTALAAKPFVILTGNSGTGKTQLAQLIAHWLAGTAEDSNHGYAVVPVGADWTDNRNVVGYVNHLRKPDGQNPIYQSAPVLDLLLRAKANHGRPCFLILDEMNLSHVERYFSDFLSAMESEKPVPLHNEKQPLQTAAGTLVHMSEPFPDNLFVIGTVNVDETTYMFSPKVLDRANVLEFRIGPDDAKDFLARADKPMQKIALATPGTAESFLVLSRRARGLAAPSLDPLAPASLKPSQETLQHLFTLLQSVRLEFAFRTITEIIRYLHTDYALAADKASWDWEESLDAQLLQKVLPKLHGSRRRLEAILVALSVYCENRDLAAAQDRLKKEADLSSIPALTPPPSIAFPRSRTKLLEMLDAVRRDQFVSFIQ